MKRRRRKVCAIDASKGMNLENGKAATCVRSLVDTNIFMRMHVARA